MVTGQLSSDALQKTNVSTIEEIEVHMIHEEGNISVVGRQKDWTKDKKGAREDDD